MVTMLCVAGAVVGGQVLLYRWLTGRVSERDLWGPGEIPPPPPPPSIVYLPPPSTPRADYNTARFGLWETMSVHREFLDTDADGPR